MMEGETVLTQYIIPYWNLEYANKSNIIEQSLLKPSLCQQNHCYVNIIQSWPSENMSLLTVQSSFYDLFFFNIFSNIGAPSDGINMVIILKRRIMNEIMTTYLPTILILIIVYTTNFFKAFFFEAVVTVNLTALLVLTTLFISVSGQMQSCGN